MRILIVEDSKVLRDYLALGLRRAGFAVDTLGDGRAALHQIEEVGYDVVILDRMLPGRRRIDDRTGPSLIKTRRGQGYILETHP